MTANQISYANLLEKQRSDLATENLRGRELEESKRATDLMRDTNLRQIEANVLNTETSAAAARYGANQAAGASMYGARMASEASKYGSDTQYKMSKDKIQADVRLKESQIYLNKTTADTKKVDTAVNFGNSLFNIGTKVATWVLGR